MERWAQTGISSLLVVERSRHNTKTRRESFETVYWASNQPLDKEGFASLCQAARGHWAIEVHHRIRDVQMGEDQMLVRNPKEARVLAGFITTAVNLLARQGGNMSELREKLTRDQTLVDQLFKRN